MVGTSKTRGNSTPVIIHAMIATLVLLIACVLVSLSGALYTLGGVLAFVGGVLFISLAVRILRLLRDRRKSVQP